MVPDGSVPTGGAELSLGRCCFPLPGSEGSARTSRSGRTSGPGHAAVETRYQPMRLISRQSPAMIPHPQFLPALTAMRGLAAWWVVLHHFRDEVPKALFGNTLYSIIAHGDLAVDFFFELSGFVIALRYADRFSRPNWAVYKGFLVARIARLYPLYISLLVLFVVNPISVLLFSTAKTPGERYDPLYFILSIPMVQNWGFTTSMGWNIPAWSVSTEWAAYLCFPCCVWLASSFGVTSVRRGLVTLGFLIGLTISCSVSGHDLTADIPQFGLLRCLFEFGVGVSIQRIWHYWGTTTAWHSLAGLLTTLGLGTTYVVGLAPDFAVLPAAFALLILTFSSEQGFGRLLSWRVLIILGEVSYSTYLVHYFVKDWVKFLLIGHVSSPFLILVSYLGVVLVVSIASYKVIEKPGRILVQSIWGERSRTQKVIVPQQISP
jgi:peptidoglycan/LPS O-acetylase OafA/YrhL